MRPFSLISPTIWTGATGRAWRAQGKDFQLLGHYLASSPHSNMYGLFYQPYGAMLAEVGVDSATAAAVLESFSRDNFAHYDVVSEWVFVVNMWERQLSGLKVALNDKRVIGLHRWYAACPSNPFLGPFFDRYGAQFHIPARREPNSGTRLRITAAELDAAAADTAAPLAPPLELGDCDRWLAHYPPNRATGRTNILATWRQWVPPDTDVEVMIATLEKQKLSPKWREDNGRYIPGAVKYLESGRWRDPIEDSATAETSEVDAEIADWKRKMRDASP